MYRGLAAVPAFLLALSILFSVSTAGFSQAAPIVATAAASSLTEQQLLSEFKRIEGRGTLPDARSYVLEQPGGRTWRSFHDIYLRWIGVGAIFSILAALTAYYLWHGTIRYEGGSAERKMLRFTAFERFVHWLTAVSFGVLALTGLSFTFGKKLLLPWMGPEAYSAWASAAKYAHDFMSFSFTLGIVLMFSIWLLNNLPQRTDIEWLRRSGGMFGGKEPPVGRFNTGEKFIFWMAVIAGAILSASGYVLLFPFRGTGITAMQIVQVAHSVVAMLFIAGMFVHTYMGTIGTEGAFDSMVSGEVDVNWAKAHHILWYAEEMARGSDAVAAENAARESRAA